MSQARGTTILYGHIATAIVGMILSLWAATQYIASALNHQARLGLPDAVVGEYRLYGPWRYFEWTYHYEPYAPEIFGRSMWFVYAGFLIVFFSLVALSIRRARTSKDVDTFGSAKWATEDVLKTHGLLGSEGIFLGTTPDGDFVRHDGPEHAFVFAPTGSGKGVGIVIPTLLSWRGSTIVYDMKRENWQITAGWRRKFSHVLRFEPTAFDSVHYNPLLEVRRGEYEVRDVQNIADILVDPEGSKERMDHWEKTGHALLVGAILHVLYAEPNKTLSGVSNFLSDPSRSFTRTLADMMQTQHLGDRVHPVVASTARELLNKSENELSGVLSTAMSFLGLYRDPVVARNTSKSDFRIGDLMNAERPVSLYLVIPPSDADRLRPLVRLMLNQIGRRLTETMGLHDQAHYKHRLLMLLDEFPTLGRLSFFESELAYLRGYGIRALMIAQSLNQIEKAYGPNNSILDNSHVRVTYGALDERTAKRISDMLGQGTEMRRQANYAGHRLAPWLAHVMVSEQESPRPLLTPGEVLQLPADEALVLIGGMPPYRAKKLRYFKDRRFDDRVRLPTPDTEAEQRAELMRSTADDWSGRAPLSPAFVPTLTDPEADAEDSAGEAVSHEKLSPHAEGGLRIDDPEPDEQKELSRTELDALMAEQEDLEVEKERAKEQALADEDREATNDRQRRRLKEQLGRQRTIEQSRGPGGGLPL